MWGLWSCVRAVPEEDSDDDQHERQAWPGIIGPDWQRLVDAYRAVVGNARVQVPQARYIDAVLQERLLDLARHLRTELEARVQQLQSEGEVEAQQAEAQASVQEAEEPPPTAAVEVAEDEQCSFCLERPVDPIRTQCGHVFCSGRGATGDACTSQPGRTRADRVRPPVPTGH